MASPARGLWTRLRGWPRGLRGARLPLLSARGSARDDRSRRPEEGRPCEQWTGRRRGRSQSWLPGLCLHRRLGNIWGRGRPMRTAVPSVLRPGAGTARGPPLCVLGRHPGPGRALLAPHFTLPRSSPSEPLLSRLRNENRPGRGRAVSARVTGRQSPTRVLCCFLQAGRGARAGSPGQRWVSVAEPAPETRSRGGVGLAESLVGGDPDKRHPPGTDQQPRHLPSALPLPGSGTRRTSRVPASQLLSSKRGRPWGPCRDGRGGRGYCVLPDRIPRGHGRSPGQGWPLGVC